jgi:NarL family two-component system response regulator LiaR
MENEPIKIFIVDDHAMVRKGIIALLSEYDDIQVVGEAPNGLKAIELVEETEPDVVLIDVLMPVMDGIETIKRIIAKRPDERIIVLTSYSGDDKLFPAIKAGAMGYLLKDVQPEELVQSIRNVYQGEPSLSPSIARRIMNGIADTEPAKQNPNGLSGREIEILCLLTKGKTDQEIAEQLVLSNVTIRTHISRIISKLGVKNRVQAALYAIQTGLVTLDDTKDMGSGI